MWKETLKVGGIKEHHFTDEQVDLMMRCQNEKHAQEKLEELRRKKTRNLINIFVECLGWPRGERAIALCEAMREFVENLNPEDLEKDADK